MTTTDHPTPTQLLRAPFPAEQIGKLPRSTCKRCTDAPRKRCDDHQWVSGCRVCGGGHTNAIIHLDFVGHADTTNRLLEVDPAWTWEPVAFGPDGLPAVDRDGGLWIRLTVCGTTRLGYGHADGKRGPDATKIAIGDALRNAAMRFGVGLDLWAKGDRAYATETGEKDAGDGTGRAPSRTAEQQEAADAAAAEARQHQWESVDRPAWERLVAAARGDKTACTQLYRDARRDGLLPAPVAHPDGKSAAVALADAITWAATAAPLPGVLEPEQVAADAVLGEPCWTEHTDGRRCDLAAGHDGSHHYVAVTA